MQAEADIPWHEAFAAARENCDALLFATGVLGFKMPDFKPRPGANAEYVKLERWQVNALKQFSRLWASRFIRSPRMSIKSGHGVGKTCFLSIVILFVLLTSGFDVKIPVVANTQDQLRDGLWPEISKWMALLPPPLRDQLEWTAEKIQLKANPESVFAVRRTASTHRPEALQGMHATTILVVFEEASGIPEATIEAGSGTLSTRGAGVLAVGNPTRASGYFHGTHNNPRMLAQYETMTVSSEDVPRARGHIEDIIAMYGRNSNKYRVRVLGEFPTADDDTVIAKAHIDAARGRDVRVSNVWPIWGVDVGRFGDDASTLSKRQGNTLLDVPRVWRQMDGRQVAGRIIKEFKATPNHEKPKRICVDEIGVGSSVVDHLRALDSPVREITVGVNVSEAPSSSDLDRKLRDELWFLGADWFRSLKCSFPDRLFKEPADEALMRQLIAELSQVTFDFDSNGLRVVESKKDMKKRLGFSPDLADGFLLTFYGGTFPRESERWSEREDEDDTSSAWAA